VGALSLCAVLSAAPRPASGDEYRLLAIRQAGAPNVSGKELIYRTDLVFSKAPESYWIFYDKATGELVMDIYGGSVAYRDAGVLGENQVFSKLQVENRETSMALSGQQALVRLKAEPGWRYEARTLNRAAVRIVARKGLSTPRTAKRRGRRVVLYVLAAIVASAGTFLLIYFVSRADK
jgi:hypothetical protein